MYPHEARVSCERSCLTTRCSGPGPRGCYMQSPLLAVLRTAGLARFRLPGPLNSGVSRLERVPGAGIARMWWSRAGASSRQQGKSTCCGCAGLAVGQGSLKFMIQKKGHDKVC